MPVEAELGVVREVAGELQKERPEVAVEAVEVVGVDHRAGAIVPRVGSAGGRIAPPLGPYDWSLLLGFADEQLYTCLCASRGHDLRAPVRGGTSDDKVVDAIASLWRVREDRYSEIRASETAGLEKMKVSYISG